MIGGAGALYGAMRLAFFYATCIAIFYFKIAAFWMYVAASRLEEGLAATLPTNSHQLGAISPPLPVNYVRREKRLRTYSFMSLLVFSSMIELTMK